eukprot:g41947.t1
MKGKAKFGKNVTEKDKQAQEEAKYQEETRSLVQAATQDISSLSYDNVEVLPDEIAGAPHKGVIDRSLDEHHVGELMNNFYTSGKPNDNIEWAETELEIGNAKIMMSDMFKMANCLYTDLPYNISELVHDQEEINEEKVKTLLNAFSVVGNSEKTAVVFHCHPSQYNMLVEALSVTGYQTIETMYWYKQNHNYVGDVQKWIKAVEMMLVAFNPKQASFTLNLDPNPILRHNLFVVETVISIRYQKTCQKLKIVASNTPDSISKAIEARFRIQDNQKPFTLLADNGTVVPLASLISRPGGSYTLHLAHTALEDRLAPLREKYQQSLRQVQLSAFPKPSRVITIPRDATVSEAVAILNKHSILAAPLEKQKEGKWVDKYVGIISMLDILLFVLTSVEKNEKGMGEAGAVVALNQAARKFDSVPVKDLVDNYVTPFTPWPLEGSNLLEPLWLMNQKNQQHVYRVMIVDTKKEDLCSVVTQGQMCQWINNNLELFKEVADMTVAELKLGQARVVSVRESDTPLDAFKLIWKHKISAVPVIGMEGLVTGTISTKDVAQMVKEGQPEALMHAIRPIHDFLKNVVPSTSLRTTPVAVLVKDTDTFRTVVQKMAKNKIHRIWVEHKDLHYLGVISMTDIIKTIAGEGPE